MLGLLTNMSFHIWANLTGWCHMFKALLLWNLFRKSLFDAVRLFCKLRQEGFTLSFASGKLPVLVRKAKTTDTDRAIPGNVTMQVTQPGGQICNLCNWRHLMTNFGTNGIGNASDITWRPNFEPVQVVLPNDSQICNQYCNAGSQISNQCKLIHMVAKFVASYAIGAMVKFVTNSIGAIWWSNLQLMRQLQLNQGPNNPIVCCASGNIGQICTLYNKDLSTWLNTHSTRPQPIQLVSFGPWDVIYIFWKLWPRAIVGKSLLGPTFSTQSFFFEFILLRPGKKWS